MGRVTFIFIFLALFILLGLTYQIPAFADSGNGNGNGSAAFDFGKPPQTRIQLLPNFYFGVRAKFEYESEINFDLDTETPDDLNVYEPSLSLALSYTANDYFRFFFNIEPSLEIVDDEENKKDDQEKIDLKQAFISLTNLVEGSQLKIGRQRIKDHREWIIDEELDSLRLSYAYSRFGFDGFIGENIVKDLTENDDRNDKATNFFAEMKYAWDYDNELGVYIFVRDDRTSVNENPIFFGFHIYGEPWNQWEYWVHFAHVRGRSGPNKIRGFGLDLGFIRVFDIPFKPALTFGYAFGTGDKNPSDGEDNNFRQTDLQDNNAKFNGVTKLKYYGELVDPELSNLHIFTGGVGFRPTKKTSIDFVYHFYLQDKLSKRIRDSNIDDRPNGLNREIGQEIDLIAAYRSRKHLTTSLVLGYFNPGKAFPSSADDAFFSEVTIQYDF